MIYIIEHMESGFTEWVTLEYSQIIRDIGAQNLILSSLPATTTEADIPKPLKDLGLQWTTKEITELTTEDFSVIPSSGISKDQTCLLDPRAESDLVPEDSEKFQFFVFGGILGDHPPRDRTKELSIKYGFEGKRLGNKQMTTDTAIRTTQIIIEKKTRFEDIKFLDYPEIRFSKYEATEMPFRYVIGEDGNPILPQGMVDLIKRDSEQSIDDLL
ncbi:protein-arginine N-methyltransferase [Saccharomycopsis crataegensis]|uniref:Protein-arginine N-methyltransferase n=1 Tax=Saccharomycopsis crataegensis TaxID=43959 RepID=A0AAV5QPR2_9ASCO|nr:protein-arginine N-methyltransferase [Saccharomycopsis crataegensis]